MSWAEKNVQNKSLVGEVDMKGTDMRYAQKESSENLHFKEGSGCDF